MHALSSYDKPIPNLCVFKDNIIRVKTRITERTDDTLYFLSPILLAVMETCGVLSHCVNFIRKKYWIQGGRKIWNVRISAAMKLSPVGVSLTADQIKDSAASALLWKQQSTLRTDCPI
ncbi:hypothetical protein TNCV_2497451 [Trichonephila clavipes]|nr:hypothetical protein TNCV_2497451 [Trichonephila clavipes]